MYVSNSNAGQDGALVDVRADWPPLEGPIQQAEPEPEQGPVHQPDYVHPVETSPDAAAALTEPATGLARYKAIFFQVAPKVGIAIGVITAVSLALVAAYFAFTAFTSLDTLSTQLLDTASSTIDHVSTFFTDLWANIKGFFVKLVNVDLPGLWNDFVAFWGKVWEEMKLVWEWIKEKAISGWEWVKSLFAPAPQPERPPVIMSNPTIVAADRAETSTSYNPYDM
jgi:hypothetical protein